MNIIHDLKDYVLYFNSIITNKELLQKVKRMHKKINGIKR